MRAELHHLGHLGAGQHRTDGEAATQRLGQGDDVRGDAFLPMRKQGAGATHAALDFVQGQQSTVAIAEFTHALQETFRRRHHSTLALDRLHQHRSDIAGCHRSFQLGKVVEIDVTETTGQWFVAFLVFRLRGRGDRGHGAAMETATERDDDPTVRRTALRRGPLANQLDRGLVGLGTGIAQEHARGEARGGDQFFGQAQRWLAVEHVAGVPQLAGLFDQCGDQVRIVVAQPAHRDARRQIQVFTTFVITDARALATLQDDCTRAVDRKVVMLAGSKQVGGDGHGILGKVDTGLSVDPDLPGCFESSRRTAGKRDSTET